VADSGHWRHAAWCARAASPGGRERGRAGRHL